MDLTFSTQKLHTRRTTENSESIDDMYYDGFNQYGIPGEDTAFVTLRPMSPCPHQVCSGDIEDRGVNESLQKNIDVLLVNGS